MKKIIFILTTFFMMIMGTNAASVNVSLSCPSAANVGDKINCNINVISDVKVNGIAANYNLNGLTFVSFTPKNNFTEYNNTSKGFSIGNTKGKSGTFTVGVATFKVTKAGSVTLTNIDVSDTNFEPYTIANKTKNIRIKSTNNKLSGLTIDKGTLTPAFDSSVTSYKATINSSSVKITATKGDSYQTVSGHGTRTLSYGENNLKVVVKSESGSSRTYTIVVTRPDNRSSNNNLSSLSVNVGKINFNKTTKTYTLNVDSDVTSMKINGTLEDSKASFVNGYGPRTVNLDYGKNTILVKAKAENESVNTYTIVVNRKDNRSNNNYLTNIEVSSGNIVFEKNITEYNMTVLNEVETLTINPVLEDSKAKFDISTNKLSVGDNKINILVTSENGEKRTYTINVKRLSEEESLSDNNNVKSITISNHEFEFKSDVYEYNVNIEKSENELIFDVVLEDQTANYTILGNENLQNGSIVKVVSISESGKQLEYKFIISKKANYLPYIIVGGIGMFLGIIIGSLLTLVLVKNKKTK